MDRQLEVVQDGFPLGGILEGHMVKDDFSDGAHGTGVVCFLNFRGSVLQEKQALCCGVSLQ